MDIDELVGKEVVNAFALVDPELGGIVHIVFIVEKLFLILSTNPDTDELEVTVQTELEADDFEDRLIKKQLSNQRKHIAWVWRMTNSRGYDDGLQIEFDDAERTNVQVIAEASQLDMTVFHRN